MNKQTTILMYNKYSGRFFTILKLLVVSEQTYYLHLYYFRMTWRALTRYKRTILCIVIISMWYCLMETSFSLDHLCHGSSLTWWPCLPISFLFFTGTCSTFLVMCASIQVSLIKVQPIPLGVTFSNAVSKLQAQSSKVSFHWNVAKETFELWALSFQKCHPLWDWLYYHDIYFHHLILIQTYIQINYCYDKNHANSTVTPVAGPIFETKNRAIVLERFFGRGITAREQLSRAKNSLDFK